jgi:hypothetical protein
MGHSSGLDAVTKSKVSFTYPSGNRTPVTQTVLMLRIMFELHFQERAIICKERDLFLCIVLHTTQGFKQWQQATGTV